MNNPCCLSPPPTTKNCQLILRRMNNKVSLWQKTYRQTHHDHLDLCSNGVHESEKIHVCEEDSQLFNFITIINYMQDYLNITCFGHKTAVDFLLALPRSEFQHVLHSPISLDQQILDNTDKRFLRQKIRQSSRCSNAHLNNVLGAHVRCTKHLPRCSIHKKVHQLELLPNNNVLAYWIDNNLILK